MNIIKSRLLFNESKEEFKHIFKHDLSDFWDIRTPLGVAYGFDLIKFDDVVVHSGEHSMKTIIKKKFGKQGLQLIIKLIGVDDDDRA